MQFFLYRSQQKLDELYPQIPRSIIKEAAREFGIKLGWFSATLKTDRPEVALAVKTTAVAKFVRRTENVTQTEGRGAYRFDRVPLVSGVLRDRAEGLAFFGGAFGDLRLVLIGHPRSLAGGGTSTPDEIHTIDQYVIRFLQGAADETDQTGTFDEDFHKTAIAAATSALKDLQRPPQPVEFLAKTIYDLQDASGRTVIATPIYVSLL